jgi:hypothetical protein
MQNGFCESFNGRMRDEPLNESLGLDHARTRIADWADDYNGQRSHSALGYLTPAAYAANLTATCDQLRNLDQLAVERLDRNAQALSRAFSGTERFTTKSGCVVHG